MRRLKPGVFLLCLAPALWLVWLGFHDRLGANPIEHITHSTGDWTLRFLLLTLALTPARRLVNLLAFRRMIGLFAFFYACLHLVTYLWLDKFFVLADILQDLTRRRYLTAGMSAFALLVPLALTSTRAAIARLGGRRWQLLHRLVYPAAALGVIHYYWLVKSDVRIPLLYAAILAALLALRCRPAR
jgi:sulfoxide reductase heme-binding subunit YedZ